MTRMQKLAGLVLCGFMAATATVSMASPSAETVSVEVRYGELDLARTAGAEVLYRRLRNATREICGPVNTRSAVQMRKWTDCYQGTLETAVATANRPLITELHRQQQAHVS